jgi:hypothetical protein
MKELRVRMRETSEVVYRLEVDDDFDIKDEIKVVEALYHGDGVICPQVLYTDDYEGKFVEVWEEEGVE